MHDKNDWSDLESFKHTGAKLSRSYVTISSRKSITLSTGFLHNARKHMDGMTHVVLHYSKKNNAIVFFFTKDSELPGATKLSLKKNALIAARAFFNYYSIDVSRYSGKYVAVLENIPRLGESWLIYL